MGKDSLGNIDKIESKSIYMVSLQELTIFASDVDVASGAFKCRGRKIVGTQRQD